MKIPDIWRSRLMLGVAVGAVLSAAWSGPATADPRGRIVFLGWTEDLQHSVWLSGVEPGEFFVVFPETGVRYDAWTQTQTGLRVTVSDEVREYGGTHNLFTHIVEEFAEYDNFVDSDDQWPGRFVFPNQWNPPSLPGGPIRPPEGPEGLMPTLPGGVQPPIGTLPPTGLTPTLPGGVQPPIGTLPPTGLTPTLPGGVQPPIGTLPPTGLTPTLPGGVQPPIGMLPPTGLTPTLPGGVQPPIGTLPPTGLTPTLPGGVQPPIGTLPPTGLTPTLPGGVQPPIGTLPPTGLMPTLPGGVQPPIGMLPPTGLTPTLPGGVQPPIGTLPPTGLMPTLPGQVRFPEPQAPPIPSPAGQAQRQAEAIVMDATALCRAVREGRLRSVDPAIIQAACAQADARASRWNSWLDVSYFDITDRRHGLDMEGTSASVTVGLDRRMSANTLLGFTFEVSEFTSDSFGGALRQDAQGYGVGIYVSRQMSPDWFLDSSLNLDVSDNRQDVLMFSGDFDSTVAAYSIGLAAQKSWGDVLLGPRVSINYSRNWNDAFVMNGVVAGQPLRLKRVDQQFDFGALLMSVETSRTFVTSRGRPITPYVELGLQYAFERPNDGDILTANLESASTSAFSGSIRMGVRARITPASTLVASTGYSSVGVPNLSLWEWRIYVSRRF